MSQFFRIIGNKNIQLLILYGWLRSIPLMGSGLFAFYVLSFLSAPPRILGFIISVGFLASAIGSIFGGYLTDRLGRKYTFIISSLSAGSGWIALSLSRDWMQVALSYGLMNGMMACAPPAYYAVISDSVPNDVGGGLGIVNSATSIVMSIGAVLGATTARYLGFELLFGIISFPWFLSAYVVLGIQEQKLEGTRKPVGWARLNPFRVVGENLGLLILSLSVFFVTLGGYAASFYPDYVKKAFNVDPLQMGIFDSIYSATWAVTNYPMGLLSDKVGRKKVIFSGYTLMGVAWLLFPIPTSLIWLFLLYAAYSLGNSMGFFTTALAMDIASERKKGSAVGMFNCFMYIGVFLSGITGGILWEDLGPLASFRISFIALIAAALIITFLVKSKEENS